MAQQEDYVAAVCQADGTVDDQYATIQHDADSEDDCHMPAVAAGGGGHPAQASRPGYVNVQAGAQVAVVGRTCGVVVLKGQGAGQRTASPV